MKMAESYALIADVKDLAGEGCLFEQSGIGHHDVMRDVVNTYRHHLRIKITDENKGKSAWPRQQHFSRKRIMSASYDVGVEKMADDARSQAAVAAATTDSHH